MNNRHPRGWVNLYGVSGEYTDRGHHSHFPYSEYEGDFDELG